MYFMLIMWTMIQTLSSIQLIKTFGWHCWVRRQSFWWWYRWARL